MPDNEKNEIMIVDEQSLRDKIYVIRGQQVMLDSDLAEIYGYETRYLNLQVRHNLNRFPEDFMFQLTKEEYENLMLKNSTSNHGGRRKPPMKIYHCGASSKDAGKKITTITRITDIDDYKNTIQNLLGNPPLILR